MSKINKIGNNFIGNSSSIKPSNVNYGVEFYEKDTDKTYYYASDKTWKERGSVDKGDFILKIDNIPVNKRTNTDYETIEIGDEIIEGEVPANSGRMITAVVIGLPYDAAGDVNLDIKSINES